MKNITTFLLEGDEYNPSFKTHKDAWNSFIKWYDNQLKHMNKHELLDMLKSICSEIENDSLAVIK